MTKLFTASCALAVALLLQMGIGGNAWAQGGPPPPADAAAAPVSAPSPSGAPQPTATPPDLPVLWVTSVEVLRSSGEPHQDIVRVTGVTGSVGWNNPQLVPLFVGEAADHILDLQFIAQTPTDSEPAHGFVPISAVFPIEAGQNFAGVRVRGAGNVVEVPKIPGIADAKVTIESCAKCVGMKFAPRGKAASGTTGVIREEDMPRNFRVIPPHKGVAGITHNMNRLNIVLGDDNETIVWAFWE